MAIYSYFLKEGLREVQIEEFLKKKFEKAGYSHIDIQRTPLGTRIIVYAHKPGIVIGKSGRVIKEISDEIKEKFGLENPMLDVKEVENPFLDAQIVADRIAKSIERGSFYKKVVNYYLEEIMKNGAVGVQIKIGGKLGGERGRFQKFRVGYIKHAGYYADNILDKGFATAVVKLGMIGVDVRIMKEMPEDLSLKISSLDEKIKEMSTEKVEIPEKTEEVKEDIKGEVVEEPKEEKKEKSKKSGKTRGEVKKKKEKKGSKK
ncbi:MAG: 30S ribosomal protein S3 [Candidatus Aenigmatarchaeota archaeon]